MFGVNPDLLWTAFGCIVLAVVAGSWHRIAAWLSRVEARKVAWHAEQDRQASDPLAHFYLTVAEIDARTPQPETFERFGRTIWRFNGQNHLTQDAADEARRQAVLTEARSFYQDVDRLRLGRR